MMDERVIMLCVGAYCAFWEWHSAQTRRTGSKERYDGVAPDDILEANGIRFRHDATGGSAEERRRYIDYCREIRTRASHMLPVKHRGHKPVNHVTNTKKRYR